MLDQSISLCQAESPHPYQQEFSTDMQGVVPSSQVYIFEPGSMNSGMEKAAKFPTAGRWWQSTGVVHEHLRGNSEALFRQHPRGNGKTQADITSRGSGALQK